MTHAKTGGACQRSCASTNLHDCQLWCFACRQSIAPTVVGWCWTGKTASQCSSRLMRVCNPCEHSYLDLTTLVAVDDWSRSMRQSSLIASGGAIAYHAAQAHHAHIRLLLTESSFERVSVTGEYVRAVERSRCRIDMATGNHWLLDHSPECCHSPCNCGQQPHYSITCGSMNS